MTHPLWTDEYWPLILQLYMQKPVGVKPLYSRSTVSLALELHIPPTDIFQLMFQLRQPATPTLRHLVDTLGSKPNRLAKTCQTIRQMRGLGSAGSLFEGVEMKETFERDWRPVGSYTDVTPVMLTMILDLYFRLIPATMVPYTPEVKELARTIKLSPEEVVEILEVFTYCDPYITHTDTLFDPILPECMAVWQRYVNDSDPMLLTNTAAQLKAYWE